MGNNSWYDVEEATKNLRLLPRKGKESDIYLEESGESIVKITDIGVFESSVLGFLDNRISLHNFIFPETFYELRGFCLNEQNRFCAILKQPFIRGTKPLEPTENEIYNYMTKVRKFTYVKAGTYKSDNYVISDLYPKNFIKDNKGMLFCIDPMITLNPENRQYENI